MGGPVSSVAAPSSGSQIQDVCQGRDAERVADFAGTDGRHDTILWHDLDRDVLPGVQVLSAGGDRPFGEKMPAVIGLVRRVRCYGPKSGPSFCREPRLLF